MPENGFLGGPKTKAFAVSINDMGYEVTIDQLGQREITISSSSDNYDNLLSVYYNLETLLMLFDGQFYPVIKAFDGADITNSWNKRSLPCYSSADFMIGVSNRLLDFDEVLDESLFKKWCSLRSELDIVHNMVLYCLSSVEMPKDMQCAFMTEAFEGLCELINNRNPLFELPRVPPKESKLKHYFLAVADKYDTEIFVKEFSQNKDGFAQILVDSRNRIAHIKSKQKRRYLDGRESVMLIVKLSLLYRIALFDLLGIPTGKYNNALLSRVQAVNDHPVMKKFQSSL